MAEYFGPQIQAPKTPVGAQYASDDMQAWQEYKRNPTPVNRSNLLKRFEGIIAAQVRKWSGPVSNDVLTNDAKLLAAKAIDTYNPNSGASLATHITNQLLPLSRVVYTYQNTVRIPENITQKIGTFNTANNMLKVTLGREPTTDELHDELGWTASEITRIRDYQHKELVESGPAVSSEFFARDTDDEDDMLLGGIYFDLTPDEKQLFEAITGYNGAKKLTTQEMFKKFNLSQAQLSYKKRLLQQHIDKILKSKRLGY